MTSERTWDWVDGIARRVIHGAALRTPNSLSERLEEEWLADLAVQRGPIARLRFALGCCWATSVIAHEHVGVATLPSAAAPLGHVNTVRFRLDDSRIFTGRTITFLMVATLHAAVLYGLAMGLGPQISKIIVGPLTARVIQPPPRTALPLPPQAQLSDTRIDLPPRKEMPPIESERPEEVETTPHEPGNPVVPSIPSSSYTVNRVQGGPGVGFPRADDFYPDASIRNGETGVATVRTCIDSKGRLISDPTIVQSTGSKRLDDGALRLAKAASGHYRATTEDGKPVDSCYPFNIRFDLRN
jgi:TonB family protein